METLLVKWIKPTRYHERGRTKYLYRLKVYVHTLGDTEGHHDRFLYYRCFKTLEQLESYSRALSELQSGGDVMASMMKFLEK